MRYYTAKKGDRIDNIVYEVYGNLDVLAEVLFANKHLNLRAVLDNGDKVYLPVIENVVAELKGISLW